MKNRLITIALLLISAAAGFGQIIGLPGQMPGQYPPGTGMGGIQLPGIGRRTRNNSNRVPTQSLTGTLRDISSTGLTIETSDKRTIDVSVGNSTRFLKQSSASTSSTSSSTSSAQLSDFDPGDQVAIDATQDDQGYYHAVNVTQLRRSTPAERTASKAPDRGPSTSDDDDRPRLRRADAAPPDSAPAPAADSASASKVQAQIIPGDSSSARVTPVQSAPAPAAPDPDDPGPPLLRRGARARTLNPSPTPSSSPSSPSEPVIVAQNRPSIQAQEANGVTTRPEAPRVAGPDAERGNDSAPAQAGGMTFPSSGDPIVDKAREEAFSFSETLPNYVVKQFTTRYETSSAKGRSTSWQALDNISADVVYENGKESYKNILVNGKTPKVAPDKTGSWSTGEFASVMQDVLSPATDADFHNKRSTTLVNRAAWHYDFSVEQPNSHWHVYAASESYQPEYTGSIWIDKENFRVLRLELSARNMPKGFPLDTVESAVDYDYVLIANQKFLLPVHSEALSCERGTAICSRNVIDFRNYRKFGADSEITFGPAEK